MTTETEHLADLVDAQINEIYERLMTILNVIETLSERIDLVNKRIDLLREINENKIKLEVVK